jgi:hypothetical protein
MADLAADLGYPPEARLLLRSTAPSAASYCAHLDELFSRFNRRPGRCIRHRLRRAAGQRNATSDRALVAERCIRQAPMV